MSAIDDITEAELAMLRAESALLKRMELTKTLLGIACCDRCEMRYESAHGAPCPWCWAGALLERLAATEAVIAALPRCDKCARPATWESGDGYGLLLCDPCDDPDTLYDELPYAAALRAWLALTEGDRRKERPPVGSGPCSRCAGTGREL